jgi:SAM-dependent methyltransferase
MPIGWINLDDYSFSSLLLLERFQIRLMLGSAGWRADSEEWKKHMGIALGANPEIMWYLAKRCPECASQIAELAANTLPAIDGKTIRAAELYVMAGVEDFIIYTTPEVMAAKCDFIRGWHKERLFALADLSGKTVLDVGAGSGRLTFAAAEKASWVYASEPVGTLREFMRDKIIREGNKNIRVCDGLVTELPFPDSTFDIVMSGHVIGDDWEAECAEITRVCKPGGWLLDCPGDSEHDLLPKPELISRGWEELHYVGSFGKNVFTHRKQVIK